MAINLGTLDPNLESLELNALINDRRDVDFADTILSLEPNAAPITVLTGRMGRRPTQEVEFRWFEEDPLNRVLTITSGGPLPAATSFSVPDASGIHAGDVLRSSMVVNGSLQEELMRVVSVDYVNNTVNVVRGYGESDAQDYSAASGTTPLQITVIGNISGEGADAPADRRTRQPRVIRNVCGIVRTPFSVTGSVDRSKQRANPQERARLQKFWGVEHRKSLEYLALFGVRTEDLNTAEEPVRVPQGIVSFIRTNLLDAGGVLTLDKLYRAAEAIFSYGDSDERWMFAGPQFITAVSNLGSDKIRIEPGEEQYGVRFDRIITPHGVFRLVRHRMLVGPVWGKAAIILDLSNVAGQPLVQYRPLQNGGDTRLRLNIQNPSEDKVRDEYFTEAGFALLQEKRHGIIFNAA